MKKKLLTPGPVPLPTHWLEELSKPVIHHRTREFAQLFKDILKKLQACFQTKNPVIVLTSTGTGAMQAALTNLFSPNDQVLFLVNGVFGQRWADMAKVFGLDVICYQLEWGKVFDAKSVAQKIKQYPNLKAVFCQACETSTGVENPIREISKAIKTNSKNNVNNDVLFVVDGITAVGVSSIKMDEDEIDVLVAGSQKAFANPTGLSFIALSTKAQTALHSSTIADYYFDLKRELTANKKFQTAFSSPVNLLFFLNKSLNALTGPYLNQQIKICKNRQNATLEVLQEFSLKLFSQSQSASLTVFKVPDSIDATELKNCLEDKHSIVVAEGQGPLKGKIIRVGHMGAIANQDYIDFYKALFVELKQMGYQFKEQALERALEKAYYHLQKIDDKSLMFLSEKKIDNKGE